MRKLGMVVLVVAIAGCGSGGVAHPLQGNSQLDILPGQCGILNPTPQTLPHSVVSWALTDAGGGHPGAYVVGVVPSSDTCLNFYRYQSYVDETFVGSASDSGEVPAGTYNLDLICQNGANNDCFVSSVTWSATY
jgi:hypothetical protein